MSDQPPAVGTPHWLPIETYPNDTEYRLLVSPAHGRVIGGHVTGDVWHLIGVGCVTGESERPTHWMPLPDPPTSLMPSQEDAKAAWRRLYVDRMVARGIDRDSAQACCDAGDVDLSVDPTDAADDELQYWSDDDGE